MAEAGERSSGKQPGADPAGAAVDGQLLVGVLVLDQIDTVDEDLALPALVAASAVLGAPRAARAWSVVAVAVAVEAELVPQARPWVTVVREVYAADPALVDWAEWAADGGTGPEPPAGGAGSPTGGCDADTAVTDAVVWSLFCVAAAAFSALVAAVAAQLGDPAQRSDRDPIRPVNIVAARVVARLAAAA